LKIGGIFAGVATSSEAMEKLRAGFDLAHRIGPETILMDVLIVVGRALQMEKKTRGGGFEN
jgi:hypothetical protein